MGYFTDEFAELVYRKKYKGRFESITDLFDFAVNKMRESNKKTLEEAGTAPGEVFDAYFDHLKDALYNRRFMLGGRILSAFGEPDRKVSYYNCTNINNREDSLEGILS